MMRELAPDPVVPGATYEWNILTVFRVHNGKIAEHWSTFRKVVPGQNPVRDERVGGSLGAHFCRRAAERERRRLRKRVGDQQPVMLAERVHALPEDDEVARHHGRALMEELMEAVLAIRARLAPHDRCGVDVHRLAVEGHRLAVRLHHELL